MNLLRCHSRLLTPILLLMLLTACDEPLSLDTPPEIPPADSTEIVIPDDQADTVSHTVSEAQAIYTGGSRGPCAVQGYIVGCVDGLDIDRAQFDPPFRVPSNLLLADDSTERRPGHCFAVALKNGSAMRNALNLTDHPELWHCRLMVYGELGVYFGQVGMRSPEYWQLLDGPAEGGDGGGRDDGGDGRDDEEYATLPVDDGETLLAGGRGVNVGR